MRNSLKAWKTLEKTTYTSVNYLRVFVSKSEFFCSCPLLAQTEFLNIALECRIPLANLRDVLLSATDLIYTTTFFPKWEGSVNFALREG